jgi:hypothetical protein
LGKYSKAIDDLKKTIELDPDNSGARTRLKEMEKRQKTDLEVVYRVGQKNFRQQKIKNPFTPPKEK